MKAIETDKEKLALQCLRYQNNVSNLNIVGKRTVDKARAVANVQSELVAMELQLAGFVAEAQDQKRILLEMGLSEEEIDKLGIIADPEVKKVVEEGTKITNILTLIGRES